MGAYGSGSVDAAACPIRDGCDELHKVSPGNIGRDIWQTYAGAIGNGDRP